MMLNVQRAEHLFIREYAGGRAICLGPDHGIVHHLSYAGPDERIVPMTTTWGHKDEVLKGWSHTCQQTLTAPARSLAGQTGRNKTKLFKTCT